jgi:WD40 repeat protein/tRNA A-37 threonylcarbamoyl transferase component Bud32
LTDDELKGGCPKCLSMALFAPDAPKPPVSPETRTLRYFGDYELVEEIAHGGMGVVYKARQVTLNRLVAVKMIRAGVLASDADIHRFRTEAEAAGSLRHPHIVAIHEVGEHDSQHYFSMDLIEGKNLAASVREHPWSAEKAAACVKTIAEAIHYAHQRGILHRDLKPSNVMVDVLGTPHITDFGLAKRLEEDSQLTASGAVLGTPSYMAPEQTMGKRAATSAACDVYSMGAILYELLTGRPPFQGETTLDTLKLVRETEPVSPRLLNPKVPRDLETICLKCLEKEPKRRYASAQELADDLNRFLHHELILARPTGGLERAIKWARRKPATAALAGVSCVAVLALAGILAVEHLRRTEHVLQRQTQEALQKAERAQQAEAVQRKRAEAENQRALANLYLANLAGAELARQNKNFDDAVRLLEECPPHLRNWEWHYLKRLCGPHTLRGNNTNVLAVAFVEKDGQVASINADGFLMRWDLTNGSRISTVHLGTNGINKAAFTRDGSRLITDGWRDDFVRVWDVKSAKEIVALKPTPSGFSGEGVAISANGKWAAVAIGIGYGSKERGVEVWNLVTGQLVHTLKPDPDQRYYKVYCLAFSPDGKRLGIGRGSDLGSSSIGAAEIWDLDSVGRTPLVGLTNAVFCLDLSPDGELVGAAGFDPTVRVWNARTGQLLHTFSHLDAVRGPWESDALRGIVFSPDGKLVASCYANGAVKVWERATEVESQIAQGRTKRIQAIAFSRDGNHLVSGGEEFSLKVMDLARTPEAITIKGYSRGLAFSRDGKRLTSGQQIWSSLDGTLLTGKEKYTLMGKPAFSAEGDRTATGLNIFDARTGSLIRMIGWTYTFIGHPGGPNGTLFEPRTFTYSSPVYGVSFSPDGTKLATGLATGGASTGSWPVKIWSALSGREIQTFTGHTNPVWDVAFSPDGNYLASASGAWDANLQWAIAGQTRLWDVRTGGTLQTHSTKQCLYSVCFSGDGRRYAASGGFYFSANVETMDRGTIKVWDVRTGKEVFSTTNLPSCIYSVALSPDGTRLVAAVGPFGDEAPFDVKLWDVESEREILTLGRHPEEVVGVAFSPDGKRIASASALNLDGVIKIWSIE